MWILSLIRHGMREAHAAPNREAFFRYKLVVWVYFLSWLALGIFLWMSWHDLQTLVSWPLAALEGIFAPDLSIFRRLFESRYSYTRRMLGGNF
jgi:hypothetical protein